MTLTNFLAETHETKIINSERVGPPMGFVLILAKFFLLLIFYFSKLHRCTLVQRDPILAAASATHCQHGLESRPLSMLFIYLRIYSVVNTVLALQCLQIHDVVFWVFFSVSPWTLHLPYRFGKRVSIQIPHMQKHTPFF